MNRSFYALLVSQTAANLGFALYTMTVVMHLYKETGSTTLSAAVTLISVAAHMGSSFFLPLITDKYKLTNILMFAQLAQLVFITGILLLLFQKFTVLVLVLLFIFLAAVSSFNGCFSPIKTSLIKAVVPEDERVKAISLLSSVDQTFLFAGWTFGGILLSFLGKEITLIFTFCLILLSIVCLKMVKVNRAPEISIQESLITRLTTGWKYLFVHKGLRIIILMDIIEAWVGTIWIGAVTLTYVEDALGKGESWWGYINGGYYLGTILGGIIVFRLSAFMKDRLILLMLSGSFMYGLLTYIYGFTSHAILALFLVLLMGPSYQIRDLAQETIFIKSTNQTILTKILAAKSTLVQFIFIFSILGISALTDLMGVRLVYILSGCLLILSSVFGFFFLYIRKQGISLENDYEKVL